MEIIYFVSDLYQIPTKTLVGNIKTAEVVEARHIAIWLIRKETQATFSEIAKLLNKSNHTAVLYAYRRIEELINIYPQEQKKINQIFLNYKTLKTKEMETIEMQITVSKPTIIAMLNGLAQEYKQNIANADQKAIYGRQILKILVDLGGKGFEISKPPFETYMDLLSI